MIPATAAGALLAAMFQRSLSFARGPVLLWLTLIGTIYGFALVDDSLPFGRLYYLAAIPVLAWVCEIPILHRLKPWKRELIRFVLMAIPMCIVMYLVYRDFQHMNI
jgi:hypothetical protein